MSLGRSTVVVAALMLPAPAGADRPLMPAASLETLWSGSGVNQVCAVIDHKGRRTSGITRAGTWRLPASLSALALSRDGELAAEHYRPGGLINIDDPLDTVLIVLRGRHGVISRLTIRDITRKISDLTLTASL
jgi:hypothetical protein